MQIFCVFLLTQKYILRIIDTSFGGIVQLVEHRTHIPYVIGSSPIAPTYFTLMIYHEGIFLLYEIFFTNLNLRFCAVRAQLSPRLTKNLPRKFLRLRRRSLPIDLKEKDIAGMKGI